jgi:hypothetical protein
MPEAGLHETSRAVHVHIGPSPLGLGLIVQATREAGFQAHIVGSPETVHLPAYERTMYRRDGISEHQVVEVASFTRPRGRQVPPELAGSLREAEEVLVTCSVRGAISQRTEFVQALAHATSADADRVFIACENTLTTAHREVMQWLDGRGFDTPETVIDRVCAWATTSDGRPPTPRHVVHHEIGEWIIPAPATPGRTLERLARSKLVTLVPPDEFGAFSDRKAWLVNAPHLVLALRGALLNVPDLRRLVSDAGVLRELQDVIATMAIALEKRHGMVVPASWALDRQHVIAQLPDAIDRILSSLRRKDLTQFLASFRHRVAEPALLTIGGGSTHSVLAPVGLRLCDVLCDGEHFSDWHELTGSDLTADADEESVAMLENCLRGWMASSEIDKQVARVGRALAGHRRAVRHRAAGRSWER